MRRVTEVLAARPGALRNDPVLLLAIASGCLFLAQAFSLAWDYSQSSLQMDLSEFYAAGESLRLGLNPYKNNSPLVSTGTDLYQYSGFLYLPLTAWLFKPFTRMSYLHFKMLWTFAQPCIVVLIGVLGGAWVARSSSTSRSLAAATLFAMAAMAAFPMRQELERGQVDLVLLLVILGSLFLIEVSRHELVGGFLLGISPLLKPHAIFIVPFLMCRRRYRALAGSVLSIALLAALQYRVLPALTRDYVENVLPRMSQNSSVSSMEFLASGKKYSSVEYEDLVTPKWNTPVVRSGQEYLRQGFNGALSSSNASLAKFLWLNSSLLTYFGQAPLSVCIYLAFLAIV
jgi:hypothetical protein